MDALDIASGNLRVIASFPSAQLGGPHFDISPDGKEVLLSTCQFSSDPYTPILELVDTATDERRILPRSQAEIGSCLSQIAFQPGTPIIAVSTGDKQSNDLKTWLLDTQHENAILVPDAAYPLAWIPNDGPLIIGTSIESQIGNGPNELRAVTFARDGALSAVTLTRSAMTFPYLGLIRTA